ncbi:hypothetical protein [Paenibacillus pinihumi]|uniref:hypothetical protein n=1 Tax=Paenibacillus pinihumi TaxID=669462 RepID=UPI00042A7ACD|nr:hypothetical protein [Paenibacillus pinihumi]
MRLIQKVEVYTQDGNKVIAHVQNYDAEELNRSINEKNSITIRIGDVIVDPRNILKIVPVRES